MSDQATTPMPERCPVCEMGHRPGDKTLVVNRDGFMACPICGASYGAASWMKRTELSIAKGLRTDRSASQLSAIVNGLTLPPHLKQALLNAIEAARLARHATKFFAHTLDEVVRPLDAMDAEVERMVDEAVETIAREDVHGP